MTLDASCGKIIQHMSAVRADRLKHAITAVVVNSRLHLRCWLHVLAGRYRTTSFLQDGWIVNGLVLRLGEFG
jgi:hypothetical protein